MRKARAAWLGINGVAFMLGIISVIFEILGLAASNWYSYTVGEQVNLVNYTQVERERSLWRQCVTSEDATFKGKCYSLFPSPSNGTYSKEGLYVLSSRRTTPALQILSIILTITALVVVGVLLIWISVRPGRWTVRSGQYTVLTAGAVLWLCAFISFISMIVYYQNLSIESYITEPNLPDIPTSWSKTLRKITYVVDGPGISMAFTSCVSLYLCSFLFLGISALSQPPRTSSKSARRN